MSEGRKSSAASDEAVDAETFQYVAYGLSVRSEIALDELVPADEASDVDVHRADLREEVGDWDGEGRIVRASRDEILLHYEQVGSFLIRGGREILADPEPDLPTETLQNFLTGVCMGVLLHQRGALVLHASAVAVGDRVAAFVGEKGMGKSTLAAAFQSQGNALVTDDVLAITVQEGETPLVTPSFPQIKLWPDALRASMQSDGQQLPRVHPSVEKRIGRAETMARRRLPLGCVFVLGTGEEISIQTLPVQTAFSEIIRHSYARRLLPRTGTSERHFAQVSQLLQSVPVVTLDRPRDLSQLQSVAEAVERYMNTLSDSN